MFHQVCCLELYFQAIPSLELRVKLLTHIVTRWLAMLLEPACPSAPPSHPTTSMA